MVGNGPLCSGTSLARRQVTSPEGGGDRCFLKRSEKGSRVGGAAGAGPLLCGRRWACRVSPRGEPTQQRVGGASPASCSVRRSRFLVRCSLGAETLKRGGSPGGDAGASAQSHRAEAGREAWPPCTRCITHTHAHTRTCPASAVLRPGVSLTSIGWWWPMPDCPCLLEPD